MYDGIKHTDDRHDAFWLADLLRLGILPEGYIYPKEDRPIRDLLRKRSHLVRLRTSLILSLHGMVARNCGVRLKGDVIKALKEDRVSPYLEYNEDLHLISIPGVGKVLGLTIMLETGPASRFASAGHYASYSRKVPSVRLSNSKVKGRGNRKNGNRYLAWAFSEAAALARSNSPRARRYYDRKRQKTNPAVAHNALASKLAKAAWHIMKDQVVFISEKVFM